MGGSDKTTPPETFAQQTRGLLTESGEWATDPSTAAPGISVPGADNLTMDEAKERYKDAERQGQEALEKINELVAQREALDGIDVDVSVKKKEPVRIVSAFLLCLTILLNLSNAKGWTTFTAVEQTSILGAAAIIANEVARMHVFAPPRQ